MPNSMAEDRLARARAGLLLVVHALGGCWALTPRIEDATAPRDFYAQTQPSKSKCVREIAVFPPGALPARPHKDVASLSATCYPGALELCEQRMKDRACELGGDALLLLESTAGPNPAGASRQSLVARSGRAVRWEAPTVPNKVTD
jgi:hypothetical protein